MSQKKTTGTETSETSGAGAGEFLRNVRAETKKITWPSWKDTRSATIVVLVFTGVSAVFLGSVDFLFSKLMELMVR